MYVVFSYWNFQEENKAAQGANAPSGDIPRPTEAPPPPPVVTSPPEEVKVTETKEESKVDDSKTESKSEEGKLMLHVFLREFFQIIEFNLD